MNIIKKWNLKKHICLSVVIVSIFIFMDKIIDSIKYNKSLEVIGEVDGPVVTFTAGNILGLIINKYTIIFIIIMLLYKPFILLIKKLVRED